MASVCGKSQKLMVSAQTFLRWTPGRYHTGFQVKRPHILCMCRLQRQHQMLPHAIRCMSYSTTSSGTKSIGGMGYFLLIIPVAAFGLGTWQIQRRKWKLGLIQELEQRTNAPPVPMPVEQEELQKLEYMKVHVRGTFDHSKEMYVGPRALHTPGSAGGGHGGSMISSKGRFGYHVHTPFHCIDQGITILVNRGWIPKHLRDPATRQEGQITGETELVGVVRMTEKRQPFVTKNDVARNQWFYSDLDEMSQVAGTEPILIDAASESTVPGGPAGGQTRVTLRNEHMQYIITWYGLSIATGLLWYYGVYKKKSMGSSPPSIGRNVHR